MKTIIVDTKSLSIVNPTKLTVISHISKGKSRWK